MPNRQLIRSETGARSAWAKAALVRAHSRARARVRASAKQRARRAERRAARAAERNVMARRRRNQNSWDETSGCNGELIRGGRTW